MQEGRSCEQCVGEASTGGAEACERRNILSTFQQQTGFRQRIFKTFVSRESGRKLEHQTAPFPEGR